MESDFFPHVFNLFILKLGYGTPEEIDEKSGSL